MAKPRVFVSSTYYDLKHIRNNLESFIDSLGYDSVLFESGDIPFHHDQPIDDSCYSEIGSCHMLVLIIGSRYGSISSHDKQQNHDINKAYEQYNSITKNEYQTARNQDIPIFIFVEANVLAEYQTFKKNRQNKNIIYAHVDNVSIFSLLDEILLQQRNNFIRSFEKSDDIIVWLRDQWAGIFADFLSKKSHETTLKTLSSQIDDLNSITSSLKEYTESILKKVVPEESNDIIEKETQKLSSIRRLHHFKLNTLISVLLDWGEPKTTPDQLFSALHNSKSLEEFLVKANFSDKFIKTFLLQNKINATKQFKELRERFVLSSESDEIDSDDGLESNKKIEQ